MQRSQPSHRAQPKAPGSPASRTRVDLTLYVADQTPRSVLAIDSCTALCETYLHGRCRLTIIDLYEHPAWAKRDDIVAVPTLIKHHPHPVRTLIGTLTDPAQVLAGLDLAPTAAPKKDQA